MLTPIGFFTTAVAILLVYKPEKYLYFLPITSIFLASSALNFQLWERDYGLHPYYMLSAFFGLRIFYDLLRIKNSKITKANLIWLTFLFYAFFVTILSTELFSGFPVFDPRKGIDEGVYEKEELKFSLNNVTQLIYLAFNIGFIVGFTAWYRSRELIQRRQIMHRLLSGFLIAGLLNTLAVFLQKFGFYPYALTHNHPSYSLQLESWVDSIERSQGFFTEPSYSGGFLVAFAAYLTCLTIFSFRLRWLFFLILAGFSILLTASSTGYAGGVVLAVAAFVLLIMRSRISKLAFAASLFMLLFVLTISLSSYEYIRLVLLEKSQTMSFLHRISSDLHALWLLEQSYGLGVGLGSNRPSSFLTYMLGNVGILGFLLFFSAIGLTIANAWFKGENLSQLRGIALALIFLLLTKALALPDLFSPDMWSLILILNAAQASPVNTQNLYRN